MTEDYYLTREKFNELRTFMKGWGKPGDTAMITLESIPGTEQPKLHIIRYIIDTGDIDDHGKPMSEKRFILHENRSLGKCEYMYNAHPVDYSGNISLAGLSIGYEFIPVDSVEEHFKEKYYDEILMKLLKLRGLDKDHEEDHETMILMIKEITKK